MRSAPLRPAKSTAKLTARHVSTARDADSESEVSDVTASTPAQPGPAQRRSVNARPVPSNDSESASGSEEDAEVDDDDDEEEDDPALRTLPDKRLGELLTSEVCHVLLLSVCCSLSGQAPRIVHPKKRISGADEDADAPQTAGELRRPSQRSSTGTLSSRPLLPSGRSSTRDSSPNPGFPATEISQLSGQGG